MHLLKYVTMISQILLVRSETKGADYCFDDFGDDSTVREIIRPVRKCKVTVLSRDSNTDQALIFVGLKLTHHHAHRSLKVMLGSLHFHLSVTLYPQELVTSFCFGDEFNLFSW